jgi:hypothetical protein
MRKPPEWLSDLVKLPSHRFKAYRRKVLVKQKKMEAKRARGQSVNNKAYNNAYNELTRVILASKWR